jgi:diketogulonate reductase-like aldo/keto reductase
LGKTDDEDDFDQYVAAKHLIRSGALNVIDTAINYRCQKSERVIGAAIRYLLNPDLQALDSDGGAEKFKITRDMLFIASKSGYVPEDAD